MLVRYSILHRFWGHLLQATIDVNRGSFVGQVTVEGAIDHCASESSAVTQKLLNGMSCWALYFCSGSYERSLYPGLYSHVMIVVYLPAILETCQFLSARLSFCESSCHYKFLFENVAACRLQVCLLKMGSS